MAVKQNFIVKSGLEVADSATVGGVFKASGLQYPTIDGNNNEVIKTNGGAKFNAKFFNYVIINSILPFSLTKILNI